MNESMRVEAGTVVENAPPRDDGAEAVERLVSSVDLEAPPSAVQRVVLRSGRAAVFDQSSNERLTIYNADGGLELTIRFTEQGPVVSVAAAALHLAIDGDMSLDCERFRLRARAGMEIQTGGDLRQVVGGNQRVEVDGSLDLRARTVGVDGREVISLSAEKDVLINGDKVCINC
jgi:hypothetical protein